MAGTQRDSLIAAAIEIIQGRRFGALTTLDESGHSAGQDQRVYRLRPHLSGATIPDEPSARVRETTATPVA